MNLLEALTDAAWKTSWVLGFGRAAQLLFPHNPTARRGIGAASLSLALTVSFLAFAAPAREIISLPAATASVQAAQAPAVNWPRLLLLIWASGAGVTVLVHALGYAALRRVHTRAHRVPVAKDQSPEVRMTPDARVAVPVAYGIVRPTVLLPASSREWTSEQTEAILAHESCHLASRDPMVLLLAQAVCALHWFNPLAWASLWRLRQDCEAVCDQAALATGIRPSAYAELLVRQSLRQTRMLPVQAVFPIVRESGLAVRVRAVLSPLTFGSSPRIRIILLPAAFSLLLLLGSYRLSFAQPLRDGATPFSSPDKWTPGRLTDAERQAIEMRLIEAQQARKTSF